MLVGQAHVMVDEWAWTMEWACEGGWPKLRCPGTSCEGEGAADGGLSKTYGVGGGAATFVWQWGCCALSTGVCW